MSVTSYSSPLFFGKSTIPLSSSSHSTYSSINRGANSNVSDNNYGYPIIPLSNPQESEGIVRRVKRLFKNNWKNMLGILGGTGLFAGYVATHLDKSVATGYAYGHSKEYSLWPDGKFFQDDSYKGKVATNGDLFNKKGCLTSIVQTNPERNDSMLLYEVLDCNQNNIKKKPYATVYEDDEDYRARCLNSNNTQKDPVLLIESRDDNPIPQQMAGFAGGIIRNSRLCMSKIQNILKEIGVKNSGKQVKKKQPRRITNS